MSAIRSRWAAIGAAVAVTLGAGGIGISHATTDSGSMPVFVPLDAPCRLADTRPAPDTVGPRSTGLGAGETYDVDGWGTVGDCTLPSDTTALALNVTAIGATHQTNLRLFPRGATLPTTANLNPSPGAPPTPNAVTVGLNITDGRFSVYNAFGTVAVVIDVIGYFDDHVHTGEDIVDGSLTDLDMSNEPGIVWKQRNALSWMSTEPGAETDLWIRPPSDGSVKIEVNGRWRPVNSGDVGWCQLQKGTQVTSDEWSFAAIDRSWAWILLDDPAGSTDWQQFASHRVIDIAIADNPVFPWEGQLIGLVCQAQTGDVQLDDIHLSATFFATDYTPPPWNDFDE